MKCSGCGVAIETYYSAPTEEGGEGRYCGPACVADAVKKWVGFSCSLCWFKPEPGSGNLHHLATVSELRHLLQPFKKHDPLFIYLNRDLGDTGSVWVHATGGRALVTHMTQPGGIDSYCRSKEVGPDTIIELPIHGKQDIHWSWTVPFSDGIRALEYFLEHGERDPSLCWVSEPNQPLDQPACL